MYRRVRSAGWQLLGLPSEPSVGASGKLIPPDLVREVLRTGGRFRMVALGGSMVPALIHGEELVFEPVAAEEVRIGDVLLVHYAGGPRYCVHRAVGRAGAAILTKGDSLDTLDDPVRGPELLGRLRAIGRRRRPVDVAQLRQRLLAALLARLSLLSVVVASALGTGSVALAVARMLRVPGFVLAYLVFRVPSRFH